MKFSRLNAIFSVIIAVALMAAINLAHPGGQPAIERYSILVISGLAVAIGLACLFETIRQVIAHIGHMRTNRSRQ